MPTNHTVVVRHWRPRQFAEEILWLFAKLEAQPKSQRAKDDTVALALALGDDTEFMWPMMVTVNNIGRSPCRDDDWYVRRWARVRALRLALLKATRIRPKRASAPRRRRS
jgi:hypothetical protein